MTTSTDLDSFQQSASDINLAATITLPPEHFSTLEFTSDFDDLGSLIFTSLELPSGTSISLVLHHHAPYKAFELYFPPGLPSPSFTLAEAMAQLHISFDDLAWVHPEINLSATLFPANRS